MERDNGIQGYLVPKGSLRGHIRGGQDRKATDPVFAEILAKNASRRATITKLDSTRLRRQHNRSRVNGHVIAISRVYCWIHVQVDMGTMGHSRVQ